MKRSFALLIGLMLVAGLAGAQEANPNTYEVAFYEDNPADESEPILTEEVSANSVAKRNEDLEDAEYVTVSQGDQRYTFEVADAGASRNSVYLDIAGDDLSVAELLAEQNANPGSLERYGATATRQESDSD